ncbi:MAG: VCBS repeat-containing protein, partial [Acidobacteriota bacterium]
MAPLATSDPAIHLVRAAALLLACALFTIDAARAQDAEAPCATPPRFADVAADWRLDFTYVDGATGALTFVEHMGGGGALIDYDNDGDLDVAIAQGQPLGAASTLLRPPPAAMQPLGLRLYRNDLGIDADGAPRPRFVDVTRRAGLARGPAVYGMGLAAGDVDRDGFVDLYLTAWGANVLWRNRGDGTFEDATASAGAGDARWTVSASFVDLDADGWLDLYLANYVDFTLGAHAPCASAGGAPEYCGPLSYRPVVDRLLRNRGDGSFDDVTVAAGVGAAEPAHGLGVLATDVDGDGRSELYVANDSTPNVLWQRAPGASGALALVDEALFAGLAVNGAGFAEASMGVDGVDLDRDGREDLVITHLHRESNTLYLNRGGF